MSEFDLFMTSFANRANYNCHMPEKLMQFINSHNRFMWMCKHCWRWAKHKAPKAHVVT